MLHEQDRNKLEDFYNALSEVQRQRVEDKLKGMLKETYDTLPQQQVNPMRFQLASDMFRILKG